MSAADDGRTKSFEIHGNKLVYDGFFKIETAEVTFETFDGTDSGRQTLEVAQRGDAVAALLYDPDPERRKVILVRQFRLPTSPPFRKPIAATGVENDAVGTHEGGWLLETVAGTLRPTPEDPSRIETTEQCLRREILEEVGYYVTELQFVARFYPSPGGSNELVHLYFAEVANWQKRTQGGGDKRGEFIEPVEMDLDEFLLRHVRREFQDVKLIVAGYWLRDHLAAKERGRLVKRPPRPPRYLTLPGSQTGQMIAINAGDLTELQDVDVWVNPENTNMQMDRVFGKSVSAAIRWKGARRAFGPGGVEYIEYDTIAEEVRKQLDGRPYVALKEVIITDPGELRDKNVRKIMHVAVANGYYEQGLQSDIPTLRGCVESVLDRITQYNRVHVLRPLRSVAFPLIGTGTNGIASNLVAPEIVEAAVRFLKANPGSKLKTIHINGYSTGDIVAIESAVFDLVARGELKPVSTSSEGTQS